MDTEKKKRNRKEYQKEYYITNREKALKYSHEYYSKNRKTILPKLKKYSEIYKAVNREKINKHAREMYWIKMGKEPPKPKPSVIMKTLDTIKKPKIKDLTKLQKKTHDIETALADLLVKKQEFILKLDAEKG